MGNSSTSLLDAPVVRLALMVLVTVLLNFGLFFVLNFLAPLVTGFVVGYLIAKIREGVIVGLIGTILSYCLVFVISEWLVGFTSAPLDVVIAIFIMGAIGAFGGLAGSFLATRMRK